MNPITEGHGEVPLAEGSYEVTVMAPGYQPALVPVSVVAGETAQLDVTLKPTLVSITRTNVEIKEQVFFNTGKSTIRPESYALLDEVVQALVDYPDITKVRVEGHTDARGGERSNLDLSRRRAASVRDYLLSKGIEASRLESEGYGESRPIAQGNDETAWALNRRVDFVIVERDGKPVEAPEEVEDAEDTEDTEDTEGSEAPAP